VGKTVLIMELIDNILKNFISSEKLKIQIKKMNFNRYDKRRTDAMYCVHKDHI